MENRLKCVKIQDDRCIYAIWRRDMKKLLLFVCVFLLISGDVSARCRLLSCGDTDTVNGWMTADVGGSQCWFCGIGPNSCSDKEVVPYIDGVGDIIGLWQCNVDMFISEFVRYEPGSFCTDSELKSQYGISGVSLENAKRVYSFEGVATRAYSLGDLEGFTGRASCIMVKCNPGYVPNAEKTECVFDDREARCTSTGGTWDNGRCSCSSSKNLKKSSSDEMSCECVSSDYESDGVNGCKKKQSVIEKEEQQRQRDEQNRRNQQLSKACTDSGGVWKSNKCQCDSAKNLKVANNVCVCLDDTIYVRNGDRCDLTDREALKRKCEAEASKASGAYWDDANGKCECNNSQYVWNGTICAINEVLVQCLSIEGANWNKLTGQCYCIDSGTVLPPEKMIENACSNVVSTVPQNQQNQQGQQVSRDRILNAVKTIDDIESNLDLSVWKNSEGGFNTSRLLSDSIAGVVLGTAGGLITSSVVKKNQVESGFEDIQCTVGGQVVAGWGDEFRVGIQ